MKAIAIFSGKGGVGKSTVSSLFALALSKRGHKVVILDLDVNTPSIPVLFGGRKKLPRLQIVSSGFESKGAILHSGKMLRHLMNEMAEQAQATKSDVCIIDMPPGTGDVHLEVCQSMKPSSFLLVVQPNNLSYEDARRALDVFNGTGIPVSGVILNMLGELGKMTDEVCGLPVLLGINMREDIARLGSEGKIDEVEDNPLYDKAKELFKSATDVDWTKVRPALYHGISQEQYLELNPFKNPPTFVGLDTWDMVRERLQEREIFPDRFLTECTTERIKRMLEALGADNSGMFMIVRAPVTVITLFPGEIGMASLDTDKNESYYGVPRVKYQTDTGQVTLFPYEVMPVTQESLLQYTSDKEHMRAPASSTARYLPVPDVMAQIEYAYGHMCGVPLNWREEYRKLGLQVEDESQEEVKA